MPVAAERVVAEEMAAEVEAAEAARSALSVASPSPTIKLWIAFGGRGCRPCSRRSGAWLTTGASYWLHQQSSSSRSVLITASSCMTAPSIGGVIVSSR